MVDEVKQKRKTAPRRAVEVISRVKCEIRKQIRQDMDERLKRRRFAEDTRAKYLAEHVKQLKAEYGVHKEHTNVFDPTATVGLGLLDEMSLVEMQERLVKNQHRCEELLTHKRSDMNAAREATKNRLAKRAANIKEIRETAAEKNLRARHNRQRRHLQLDEAFECTQNSLLLEAVDNLNCKHVALTDNLKKLREEQHTRNNQISCGDGAQGMKKTHNELLKGAERIAKIKQCCSLELIAQHEAIKIKEERQNLLVRSSYEAEQRRSHAQTEDRLRQATLEMVQLQKVDAAHKKKTYTSQKKRHKEKISSITDPYTERINSISVIRARRHTSRESPGIDSGALTLFKI